MKRIAVISVFVVLLIAYLIWRVQPEQVLKRRCKSVIALADQASGGVGLFDVSRLEKLLGDHINFQIEVVSSEIHSANRIEALSGYQWIAENVKKSDFEIEEFTSIEIEEDKARVKSRVQAVLEMPEIRMMDGVYLVEFGWLKDEKGDWRLIEVVWK